MPEMRVIQPAADMCCGCVSLLTGVQAVSFITLLYCVITISLISSKESIVLSGLSIPPTIQVLAGTWALFGIPLAIVAGVSMLYRVEGGLRAFYYYHCASLLAGIVVPVAFIASGALCATVADKSVQRMGSSFACGVVDVFTFFWLALVGFLHAYFIYIIWSAAEAVLECPFPELEKYREQLRAAAYTVASPVKPQPMVFRSAPAPMFVMPPKVMQYSAPAMSYAAPVVSSRLMSAVPVVNAAVAAAPVQRFVSSNMAAYSPRSMTSDQPAATMSSATYAARPVASASYVLPAAASASYASEPVAAGGSSLSYVPTPPMSRSIVVSQSPINQMSEQTPRFDYSGDHPTMEMDYGSLNNNA